MKLAQASLDWEKGMTFDDVCKKHSLNPEESRILYHAMTKREERIQSKQSETAFNNMMKVVERKRKWRYDNPKFA